MRAQGRFNPLSPSCREGHPVRRTDAAGAKYGGYRSEWQTAE